MFTLYRTTFAPAEKPYCSAEPLFTNENSDFGVISVTERSWVAPFSKLESHISDRCSHYAASDRCSHYAASDSFACWQEKLCGILNIALLWRYGQGNRTEWSPIRSVVVRVFNKLPVCLITSMIADQIGLHSVLLPINHNFDKFQIYKALFLNQNTRNSKVFLLAAKRKVI